MPVLPFSSRATLLAPENPPATGNPVLEAYLQRELVKLFEAISGGRCQQLSLEILGALPPKPYDGMVAFFAAGVAGAGAGLYERVGAAWVKL